MPWTSNGSIRWRGVVEGQSEKTLHESAPYAIRLNRILCWKGRELLLRTVRIASVEQVASEAAPIPLQLFEPTAVGFLLNMTPAATDERIEIVLANPTSRPQRYDAELSGLRVRERAPGGVSAVRPNGAPRSAKMDKRS
jgi:hypothetical protein